ncbi:hypothetical protein B296_00041371 [Ensete ventricosum]|uniref:Uncharacterized protein n=1 Tax=Ensete ventricosum TaxID=4639 RepID=A0A426XD03_ENSVE|nr:hypothetical protein B296_00041371 [Ensete ventricosum]
MELQPDVKPRSNLGIGPGSNDAVEPCQEFAKGFTERIGKLAGNTLGDRRKKTIGLVARMLEATELGGSKPPMSSGWTARALEIGRRPIAVDG